jgi:hypothetical protein
MTDNFTPVLIIPPFPRPHTPPSQIIELQLTIGVYVPYILKLAVRKFLTPEQRQISFLFVAAQMSSKTMLKMEFPSVLWLFQEIAEVQSEFYFVL